MAIMTRQERERAIALERERRIRNARKDVNCFIEFVMRSETGGPIAQSEMHVEWQKTLDENPFSTIMSFPEAGKTINISVGRTLFELGHDSSLRFLALSHKQDVAEKIISLLKDYIENSIELHEVFPDLLPGEQWGAHAFTIRRSNRAKDPTFQIATPGTDPTSARIDRVIGDDILTFHTTYSPKVRADTISWWPSVMSRLTARGRVIILGNAWHPEDLYHWLEKLPGWCTRRYPVMRLHPVTGEPISAWPEVWPIDRIFSVTSRMLEKDARRVYMCEARSDSTEWFPRQVIDLALRLGEGLELAYALATVPRGYKTYTGVDLAVKQKDSNDTTALFTIACDPWQHRSLLCIERGRWAGPEIVRRVIDTHRRFKSEVWVEDNGSQDFIRQFAVANEPLPIRGFTTGRNKMHPEIGVASIATEMAQGKWKIPNHMGQVHPIVQQWLDEMLYYDPQAHTGDSLMASWFAQQGARRGASPVGRVRGFDLLRR